ncbi:hypothetical protein PACTADRAFT_1735 [Pachysolen tannophilus NRRL Y-2460]|uniref:Cleavage/polyadenylation specificity factor A subunit N-terminal domain-containing protein n=1 Tax=Pachysolen tannophilus NRRL Y-2460 TaxID=669874 RepID=A0A1E4TZJ0_PACTA|nr:hypothetical protein PACTADRAFT_1735 [Pachysolen tannophilus NRRL Y-2460]
MSILINELNSSDSIISSILLPSFILNDHNPKLAIVKSKLIEFYSFNKDGLKLFKSLQTYNTNIVAVKPLKEKENNSPLLLLLNEYNQLISISYNGCFIIKEEFKLISSDKKNLYNSPVHQLSLSSLSFNNDLIEVDHKNRFAIVSSDEDALVVLKFSSNSNSSENLLNSNPLIYPLWNKKIISLKFLLSPYNTDNNCNFVTISRNSQFIYNLNYYKIKDDNSVDNCIKIDLIKEFNPFKELPNQLIPLNNGGVLMLCNNLHLIYPPPNFKISKHFKDDNVKLTVVSCFKNFELNSVFKAYCVIDNNRILANTQHGELYMIYINSDINGNNYILKDWKVINLGYLNLSTSLIHLTNNLFLSCSNCSKSCFFKIESKSPFINIINYFNSNDFKDQNSNQSLIHAEPNSSPILDLQILNFFTLNNLIYVCSQGTFENSCLSLCYKGMKVSDNFLNGNVVFSDIKKFWIIDNQNLILLKDNEFLNFQIIFHHNKLKLKKINDIDINYDESDDLIRVHQRENLRILIYKFKIQVINIENNETTFLALPENKDKIINCKFLEKNGSIVVITNESNLFIYNLENDEYLKPFKFGLKKAQVTAFDSILISSGNFILVSICYISGSYQLIKFNNDNFEELCYKENFSDAVLISTLILFDNQCPLLLFLSVDGELLLDYTQVQKFKISGIGVINKLIRCNESEESLKFLIKNSESLAEYVLVRNYSLDHNVDSLFNLNSFIIQLFPDVEETKMLNHVNNHRFLINLTHSRNLEMIRVSPKLKWAGSSKKLYINELIKKFIFLYVDQKFPILVFISLIKTEESSISSNINLVDLKTFKIVDTYKLENVEILDILKSDFKLLNNGEYLTDQEFSIIEQQLFRNGFLINTSEGIDGNISKLRLFTISEDFKIKFHCLIQDYNKGNDNLNIYRMINYQKEIILSCGNFINGFKVIINGEYFSSKKNLSSNNHIVINDSNFNENSIFKIVSIFNEKSIMKSRVYSNEIIQLFDFIVVSDILSGLNFYKIIKNYNSNNDNEITYKLKEVNPWINKSDFTIPLISNMEKCSNDLLIAGDSLSNIIIYKFSEINDELSVEKKFCFNIGNDQINTITDAGIHGILIGTSDGKIYTLSLSSKRLVEVESLQQKLFSGANERNLILNNGFSIEDKFQVKKINEWRFTESDSEYNRDYCIIDIKLIKDMSEHFMLSVEEQTTLSHLLENYDYNYVTKHLDL